MIADLLCCTKKENHWVTVGGGREEWLPSRKWKDYKTGFKVTCVLKEEAMEVTFSGHQLPRLHVVCLVDGVLATFHLLVMPFNF